MSVLPAYLIVSNGAMVADLLTWLRHAREAFDVTIAMDAAHPDAYSAVRRACARSGTRFVPVQTPDAAAAVIASRRWACIEITPADARLLSAVRAGAALTMTRVDDLASAPQAIRHFDLVLCGAGDVAEALAPSLPDPGALRVSPPLVGDPLLHPADVARQRLAIVRAAMSAKSAGHAARRPALLQVVPHWTTGADQGSRRHVTNLCQAVRLVDADLPCQILSSGTGKEPGQADVVLLAGDPAVPDSFDPSALDTVLSAAGMVHVHQCLTRFGLFVAARARLLGCRVVGTDHGGTQAPFLASQPHVARLFDVLQTCSTFGDLAALNLPVRTVRLAGPVDDGAFPLSPDEGRDRSMALVLGPVLPHKGIEAVIDALPSKMHLVVAGPQGDPAYLAFLQARAGDRPVRFVAEPDQAALHALLARAGVYVQASTATDYLGREQPWPGLLDLTALECMCTGMPSVIGRAGAPGELAGLAGCQVAESAAGLAVLMRRHADGTLPHPRGGAIHDAVVKRYGLRQFGERYLAMVDELLLCAS